MQLSDIGAIPLEICPLFVCATSQLCVCCGLNVCPGSACRGALMALFSTVKRPSIAAVHKQHMQYSYSSCELNAPPFARHLIPFTPRVISIALPDDLAGSNSHVRVSQGCRARDSADMRSFEHTGCFLNLSVAERCT